jgi:hypothetical protein
VDDDAIELEIAADKLANGIKKVARCDDREIRSQAAKIVDNAALAILVLLSSIEDA